MEKIEIIRAINEASQDYYDPANNKHEHLPYLNKCNELLLKFFKSCLEKENKNKFLFSALTSMNKSKGTFDVVRGNHDTGYNFDEDATKDEKEAVSELLKDAGDVKEAINLTSSLLLKKLGMDFIFFNGEAYESDIVNNSSVQCFDLGKLSIPSDRTKFVDKTNTDEFKKKLQLDKDIYSDAQYARYLWHYKNIQQEYYKRTKADNFYVHLIRPSINEFDYNLLLSLATKEKLKPNQLAFIDLLIYRIVSQTAIEKIKQDEEIERLRNVSASTHVIKTTINGLFAPPLNSLLQGTNVDARILELDKAKSKLLKYAEVINLITKLSSNHKDDESIKESLTGSGLFTINEGELGEIESILTEILELRKNDPSLTALTFMMNDKSLAKNVFVYENDYYPAKSFYELLLLTIIENVVKHGATDDGKLTVSMNLSEKEITFVNKPKPNNKKEIRAEDMTGNFRVFQTILNKLGLGTFTVINENSEFKVTLKAKENE